MTRDEFWQRYENFDDDLNTQYMEFIQLHAVGDRMICNGDDLVEAAEDGYLFEEFEQSMVTE